MLLKKKSGHAQMFPKSTLTCARYSFMSLTRTMQLSQMFMETSTEMMSEMLELQNTSKSMETMKTTWMTLAWICLYQKRPML